VRWYYRKKAIISLRKHNLYMREVEILLETWIKKAILDGNMSQQEVANERNELLKKEYALKRIEMFLEYLDHIK
jgi:hypothetical protein